MIPVTITEQSCGCRDLHELRVVLGDLRNCQLKCPFCFTLEQQPCHETITDLTPRDLRNIKFVRFTGGEPLKNQAQVDAIGQALSNICRRQLASSPIVVIQTNALSLRKVDLAPILDTQVPKIFEVSFKGTNAEEFQYLTFARFISLERAEILMNAQLTGYQVLLDAASSRKNVKVLARLGIFHSSIKRPTFVMTNPENGHPLFDPARWDRGIREVLKSQAAQFGSTFERKLVVEKIKTGEDGTPNMGARYRRIIDMLKDRGLLREVTTPEPLSSVYASHYFYKRGHEIYLRAAEAFQ